MRKCVVAAALVCGALPVGAIAESAQAASVADFYELAKPTGKGPFPAVVLAPGCGGFHDEYSPPVFDKYRKLFVNDGFAVINVDFTQAHGIPGCANANGFLISSEDYARDILTAVTDLAKDSKIDPNRINLIGWSFGGARRSLHSRWPSVSPLRSVPWSRFSHSVKAPWPGNSPRRC
jgi:poly(3-hydroxybutyrate) depolymerase